MSLTICLKTLESLVLEKVLSGTQRATSPSLELVLVLCILAIMAFSSFCSQGQIFRRLFSSRHHGNFHLFLNLDQTALGFFFFFFTDPLLAASKDQEGLNAVLLEIGVPLTPKTRLHFVVAVKILQCGLCDVDPSAEEKKKTEQKNK